MSIIGQTTAPSPSEWGQVGGLVPFVAVAIGIAMFAGVFKRGSTNGPRRLEDKDELGVLLVTLLMGLLLWITIPTAVVLWMMRKEPGAATQPSAIPPHISAVASTASAVIAAIFLIIANFTLRRGGLRGLGLSAARMASGLFSGIVGAIIVVPLVFFVATLTQLAWQAIHYQHPREHDLLKMLGESQNPKLSFVLLAAATLVAPVFEEMLFRGHLQTLLTYAFSRLGKSKPIERQSGFDVLLPDGQGGTVAPVYEPPQPPQERPVPAAWMRWLAIIITSLLFAVVHPLWTVPPIFFLALCLGYAYERTGNLWTVIVMHALFNATSTSIYLLFPR